MSELQHTTIEMTELQKIANGIVNDLLAASESTEYSALLPYCLDSVNWLCLNELVKCKEGRWPKHIDKPSKRSDTCPTNRSGTLEVALLDIVEYWSNDLEAAIMRYLPERCRELVLASDHIVTREHEQSGIYDYVYGKWAGHGFAFN